MSAVTDLATDIQTVDSKLDLGLDPAAQVLAEALVALGWTKVVKPLVTPLSDYKQDQVVLVLGADSAWREGRVREITREAGKAVRLSVDTERGPVTIASHNRIRNV